MAQPTSQSSGLIGVTAGTLLYTGKNIVNGFIAGPGATVTIFDNATGVASGPIISQFVNASTNSQEVLFNIGVRVDLGLTVVTAGASNNFVYFGGN